MGALPLALAAAILFGVSTPANKLLLAHFDPFQLAGLLYLGAALAMVPQAVHGRRRPHARPLDGANRWRLAGAVFCGGVVAPVLLLAGLRQTSAATTSLLLNLEPAATALLGVLVFHDHLSPRGGMGVAGIAVAGAMLSWQGGWPSIVAALLVAAACVCWGLDNQLMALIDGMTPSRSTLWKGGIAGAVNLAIGLSVAPFHGSSLSVVAALAVGAVSYGVSIALYITAAQHLGATRAQGVFASAPFIGAALSLMIFGDPVTTIQVVAAGALMVSVAGLVTGEHRHDHQHGAVEHIHSHRHDDGHHFHEHPELPPSTRHTHRHNHQHLAHAHPHWPDLHHRHSH